jgi:Tfp pilus assembly protein PilE
MADESAPANSWKNFLLISGPVLAVLSAVICAVIGGYVSIHTKSLETDAQAAVEVSKQNAEKAITEQKDRAQDSITTRQTAAEQQIAEKKNDTDSKIAELKEKTTAAIAEQQNSVQKGELFSKLISDLASDDAHKSSVALLVLWQVYPNKDFVVATALAVNNEGIIPTLRLLGADPAGHKLLRRYQSIGTPQQKAAAQAALGEIAFVGDIQNKELKERLEGLLKAFQKYLQGLGFANVSSNTRVVFAPAEEAFYNPNQKELEIGLKIADDPNTVLRQYAHHALGGTDAHTRSLTAYDAIESGLASYYACSFTGHGVLGDQAISHAFYFDLNNNRRIDEIRLGLDNWDSVQNDGSEVWGGVFWQMKQLLGKQNTDALLFKTWSSIEFKNYGDDAQKAYHDFLTSLFSNEESMGLGNRASQIRALIEARGLQP